MLHMHVSIHVHEQSHGSRNPQHPHMHSHVTEPCMHSHHASQNATTIHVLECNKTERESIFMVSSAVDSQARGNNIMAFVISD